MRMQNEAIFSFENVENKYLESPIDSHSLLSTIILLRVRRKLFHRVNHGTLPNVFQWKAPLFGLSRIHRGGLNH